MSRKPQNAVPGIVVLCLRWPTTLMSARLPHLARKEKIQSVWTARWKKVTPTETDLPAVEALSSPLTTASDMQP